MIHINDLPGKEICKGERYQERRITFKKVAELINDKKLKKPNFQIDLDEDKIDEMIKSYKKHPEYLIFKDKIVIAMTVRNYGHDNYQYNMYIVDGQHRLEMAKKLYEEDQINDNLNFCFFKIDNDKDMKRLFNEINKDSYKLKKYISLDDFNQNIYDDIKEHLIVNKLMFFSEKKREINKRYTISEFLDKLSDKKIFDKYKKTEDFVKALETKNKIFNNMIDYLEYYNDTPCPFYKDEEDCVRNGIIYTLKNNNFIDFFADDKVIPDHKFKISKKYISPQLRMLVWNRYFGKSETGLCPICDCKIRVGKNGFHCGHIISEANGGETTLDNLRPICPNCNFSMGSTNWNDYVKNRKV